MSKMSTSTTEATRSGGTASAGKPRVTVADRIAPFGPQIDFISCPVFDVFYGGARGGGKTFAIILDFVAHAHQYGKAARGIIFRRTYDELEEVERISREILGGAWHFSPSRRTWTSPEGATLKLRYLDRDEDADRYQGHQYSRIYVDDAGLFPSPAPIDKLLGSLRSPEGIPVGLRLTGNPMGPGHRWLKTRYIDPAPPWTPFKYRPLPEIKPDWEIEAVFIPATLDDNPFLMQRDPDYERRLAATGGPNLFRAWRYGDWTIETGAALEITPSKHIVRPFNVPDYWTMFGAFDWGYAHWWVFGTYAVNEDGRVFCVDTIRGRRMRDPEIINEIKRRTPWQRLRYIAAGHDCFHRRAFSEDDTPTTAERFAQAGLILSRANTDRILGLRQMREMLAWRGTGPNGEDDDPRFVWMDTPGNRRSIAAIEAMVINPDNPEDVLKVDSDYETGRGGDDDYDQLRYALASRIRPPQTPPTQTRDINAPDILAIEADQKRRVKRDRPKRKTFSIAECNWYIEE
jgi:hypothetical protein